MDSSKLFKNVLLASDFDGTLADSHGEIPDCVRKAVGFFIENGGCFTVCTGRTRLGFHKWNPELINAPVLLANGALAYDYGREEIFFLNGIGDEGLLPIKAVHRSFPALAVELYTNDMSYVLNISKRSERHFTSMGLDFKEIESPEQAPRPWIKVMLGGSAEDIQRAQAFLKDFPEVHFLPTTGEYLEILGRGVDKGTALLKLADGLNINHRDVYSVGDGYNDVDMLKAAAKGFVPANGDEFAKANADEMVGANDEGAVAQVIEYLQRFYAGRL